MSKGKEINFNFVIPEEGLKERFEEMDSFFYIFGLYLEIEKSKDDMGLMAKDKLKSFPSFVQALLDETNMLMEMREKKGKKGMDEEAIAKMEDNLGFFSAYEIFMMVFKKHGIDHFNANNPHHNECFLRFVGTINKEWLRLKKEGCTSRREGKRKVKVKPVKVLEYDLVGIVKGDPVKGVITFGGFVYWFNFYLEDKEKECGKDDFDIDMKDLSLYASAMAESCLELVEEKKERTKEQAVKLEAMKGFVAVFGAYVTTVMEGGMDKDKEEMRDAFIFFVEQVHREWKRLKEEVEKMANEEKKGDDG